MKHKIMGIVFWVLVGFGSIILMILIFGFLSPRYTRFEKSIEINSTPEKVFEQINSLKNFVHHWSPWTEKDPNSKMVFRGPETGVGAGYDWEGDRKKVGKGSMDLISSEHNTRVVTHIKFDGRGEADAAWSISNLENGKVRVTWDFYSDNKSNPIARLFGRMMDKFIGPDYEYGLKKLKAHCEK